MGTEDDTLPKEQPDGSVGASLAPGELVDGRYRVVGEIGRGVMGVVYRALDPALERTVAIKLVAPALAESTRARRQFQEEARAMARVDHPNVVGIHAFGEHRDVPYIVMQLVEGEDLDTWMQRQSLPLPLGTALGVLRSIGAGLRAIHEAGAVHGDLKPANVLVEGDGSMVVTDLGLVRLLDKRARRSEVVGTPAYMAPEILTLEKLSPELAVRSDVYSLAVIAFELLTGEPPFEGELVELLNMHATLPPRPPSSLRPELGEIGDAVLLAGLAKDPRMRTHSVAQFVSDLEGLVSAVKGKTARVRIAIIDDDPEFAVFARMALRGAFPGAQIEVYPTGDAGIAAVLAEPPSAVLLDLQLPDTNGLEVLAAIRSSCPERVPLAVITAVGGAKDWKVLSSLGADAFLAKPIAPDDLVVAMQRLLGRGSVPPSQPS